MDPARPSAEGHGCRGGGGEGSEAPSSPKPRNPPARAGSSGAAGGRTWACRRPRGSCPDSLRPGKLPALAFGRKSNPTLGGGKIAKNMKKPCNFGLKRACACCHLRAMTAGVRLANARRSGGEKAEKSAPSPNLPPAEGFFRTPCRPTRPPTRSRSRPLPSAGGPPRKGTPLPLQMKKGICHEDRST